MLKPLLWSDSYWTADEHHWNCILSVLSPAILMEKLGYIRTKIEIFITNSHNITLWNHKIMTECIFHPPVFTHIFNLHIKWNECCELEQKLKCHKRYLVSTEMESLVHQSKENVMKCSRNRLHWRDENIRCVDQWRDCCVLKHVL